MLGAVTTTIAALLVTAACSASPPTPPGAAGPAGTVPSSFPVPSASVVEGAAPVPVTAAVGADPGAAAGQRLTLPPGWSAQVWAAVGGARMLAWTPDGDLLVSTDRAGTVIRLHPGGSGAAPAATTLLAGLDRPQGVSVGTVAGRTVLVVGEQTRVTAWTLAGGRATTPVVLAAGLPGGGLHYGKFTVLDGGTVHYIVGTASDNDPTDRTGSPQRGVIASVPVAGGASRVVSVGVRNGEGLSIAPDGTLFTAVNQVNQPGFPFHAPFDGAADGFGRQGDAWALDHPVDQVTRVTPGGDLGWPYCQPDTRSGRLTAVPYVNDPVNNPDGAALDCTALPATQVGLPAHSAPIGLHFLTGSAFPAPWRGGAVVAAHGSFRRDPPREPALYWMPWDAQARTLGAPQVVASGWQLPGGSRWGRPVDAVPGPDGALYVSDDQAGLIYRLTPARV